LEYSFLKTSIEIDKNISADNELKTVERTVGNQIMGRKNQFFLKAFIKFHTVIIGGIII
jgi:hypothetical protein